LAIEWLLANSTPRIERLLPGGAERWKQSTFGMLRCRASTSITACQQEFSEIVWKTVKRNQKIFFKKGQKFPRLSCPRAVVWRSLTGCPSTGASHASDRRHMADGRATIEAISLKKP
jgi:hypothetical protein